MIRSRRRETAAEIAGYAAYDALASMAAVPAALVMAAGAAVFPRWRFGISERAGFVQPELARAAKKRPVLWVHAASIGEVRAAHPLLALIARRRPDLSVIITTTTPEGNRTARALSLSSAVSILPVDSFGGPARLLDAMQPDALVLLETELWPGLLRAARRRLVPVLVVNGRISHRSFRRYLLARPLLAPVLDDVAYFAMQAEVDERRILALGADRARVSTFGNLKFDAVMLPAPAAPSALAALAGECIWVAGSTHEGEETLVADAFLAIRAQIPGARLIVAPRHVARAGDAEAALASRGLRVVRRSTLSGSARPEAGAVILLDSSGELAGTYSLASAVFVGGSLIPRGGHNPLEPLAHGVPVAFGPHTGNFADVCEAVLSAGASARVTDAASLARVTQRWLSDPAAARGAGASARAAIASRNGAAARAMSLLEVWLGPADTAREQRTEWLDLDRRPAARMAARAAAHAYRIAVGARAALYDARALPVARAGVPVISVGGIVAGGSGKTPAVIYLARRLLGAGRRVAVVSRGYGATPGPVPRVVSRGGWAPHDAHAAPAPTAAQAGDEPLLIASRAPGAAVVVHPDRIAATAVAESLGADIVLLDDGFQHRRLARGVDVVLVDARAPFGNGRFLPAGPLRDLPRRLADAALVLVTRSDLAPGAAARTTARIGLVSDARTARFAHRLERFEHVSRDGTRTAIDAGALAMKRPYAFAAIADPEGFFDAAARAGAAPVGLRGFADHTRFDASDIADVERDARAAQAESLLTTEKDLPRISGTTLPLYVAALDFAPLTPDDAATVEEILARF